MFEAIQEAYELLLPIVESGQKIRAFAATGEDGALADDDNLDQVQSSADGFVGGLLQMQTMQLLIRTQSLICRRFEKEMSKYKYPAYKILLSCLNIPESCKGLKADPSSIPRSCLMTTKRAQFVRDAVELVFRTCLVSPLNAEELVAESGVVILESLLDFYIHAASCLDGTTAPGLRGASDTTISGIISTLVHTIAGIAYYESGRAAIVSLPECSCLCINWRRCLDGRYLGSRMKQVGDSLIKKFALEGVVNMSKNRDLQDTLVGAGIVWPLGRFMLGFDPTLEEGSMSRDSLDDDIAMSQAASNAHARLAARALGMLCGLLQDPALATPQNLELQNAMNSILTSSVALLLRNKRTSEILRTLNTNVETPARIWNVGMRNEMFNFLESLEKDRPEDKLQSVEEELGRVSSFGYTVLKDELRIGGVYVRVFNQLGLEKGALRDIHNPNGFAKQLTDFIAKCINASQDLPKDWVRLSVSHKQQEDPESDIQEPILNSVSISDRRFLLVITALRILVRVDGLIDDVLCETSSNVPSVLLSLLELPQDSEVR
jgi:DnaJ family protein C protein 13